MRLSSAAWELPLTEILIDPRSATAITGNRL
jgi:hypothetical protein